MREQEIIRDKITAWVNTLKAGDGDYRKLYTENLMELYIITGCATPADTMLLRDMRELTNTYKK